MNQEQSIISALAGDIDAVKEAFEEGLRSQVFENATYASALEFIFNYWLKSNHKLVPTQEVLQTEFPSLEFVEVEESLWWLIDKQKTRFKELSLYSALEEVATIGAEEEDPDKALSVMAARSFEIIESTTERRSFSDLSENVPSRQERYLKRAQFENSVAGAPLGLAEVDEYTGGIMPGDVVTLAAYAGVGKTWGLCQSVVGARLRGFTPYLATLELQREDIEDRLDCIYSGIPFGKLMRGSLSKEQIDTYKSGQEDFAKFGPVYIDYVPSQDRTVQGIFHRARQRGADFVIIDQLSFIRARKDYRREDLRWVEIMEELKVTTSGSSDKIANLTAVQFNRDSKKSGKGQLHNHSGSIAIEQFTDAAYGYNQSEEMKLNNAMELSLMKHRKVAPTRWNLSWRLHDRTEFRVDETLVDHDAE